MRLGKIDNLRIVGNIHSTQNDVSFEEFVGAAVPSTSGSLKVVRMEINNLVNTIQNLTAFKNSVARFGLTRSILSLADHDKTLSELIPEVPAIEVLVSDRSAKNSVDVVVAVENKISALNQYTANTITEAAKSVFAHLKDKTAMLIRTEAKMKILTDRLVTDERSFFKEPVENAVVETAPTFEALILGMQHVQAAQKVICAILEQKLPTNELDFNTWVSAVRTLIEPVQVAFPFTVSEIGAVEKNKSYVSFESFILMSEDSILALGYDSLEKLTTIHTEFQNTITSLLDCDVAATQFEAAHISEGEVDTRVFNYASEMLLGIVQENDQITSFLTHWPLAAAKAIFWCTEAKQD